MKLKFAVSHFGEPAAGIIGYSDMITISVKSGDPGGEAGEFEEHMMQAIKEWYDGAKVMMVQRRPKP